MAEGMVICKDDVLKTLVVKRLREVGMPDAQAAVVAVHGNRETQQVLAVGGATVPERRTQAGLTLEVDRFGVKAARRHGINRACARLRGTSA